MTARFDLRADSPECLAAMMTLHAGVKTCGLDEALLELVKIRVSQINGCAFCIDMHVTAACQLGVDERRLHLLAAWREAAVFDATERAALEWAETLTRLPNGEVSDDTYARVSACFSRVHVAGLSFAVAEINAWNRLMMATRRPPMSAAEVVAHA